MKIAKYEKEFQALLFSYKFDKASKYYKSIIDKGISSKNKDLTVLGYKLYGNLLQHEKKLDSSILIKKKAIKINNNPNNKFHGDLTLNLAISYSEKSEQDSTLAYYLKAEKAYKKIKNHRGLCYLYNSLSLYYITRNELLKSENAIQNLFLNNQNYKNVFFEGEYYNRLGQIKSFLGAYDESKIEIKKALKIYKETGNTYSYMSAISHLIGLNLLEEKKWGESRVLMNEALGEIKDKKIPDEVFVIVIHSMNCTILLHENKIDEAKIELKKLNEIGKKYKYKPFQNIIKIAQLEILLKENKINQFYGLNESMDISNSTPDIKLGYLRLLYKANLGRNNLFALKNLEKYWTLKDSLSNSILLKNIIYNQEKFESRKKEKENLKLKKDKAEQSILLAQESKRKWQLGTGLLTALVTLLVFTFFYRRNKKQKEVIESMQKELHHRIKNNLSIIDTFIEVSKDDFDDPKFSKKLTELQNRIDSINEVHQQLCKNKDVTKLDIKKYIDTLSNNVANSFSSCNITIEKSIRDNLNLHADKSFPVGLIINEFLTNSYKYAFDNEIGNVKIEITDLDDNYQLKLSDNGKGLPQNFDIKTTESFGLRIMKLLTEQLNGNFNLSNKDGVSLIINFPK